MTWPWFAVTMTVKNNGTTIGPTLDTILPQLSAGGELAVVDGGSTDGTMAEMRRRRVNCISVPCNRGEGRNLAFEGTVAPIVLAQVDGDNLYEPFIFARVAAALQDQPNLDLLIATGLHDPAPGRSHIFAWRRAAFNRMGGYPPEQEGEDAKALLRAFRAGLRVDRVLFRTIATDQTIRSYRTWGYIDPLNGWKRATNLHESTVRHKNCGYHYADSVRFMWFTRTSLVRFVAGAVIAAYSHVTG